MHQAEEFMNREERRNRFAWIACGVSIGVAILFALWVISLVRI